MRGFSLVEAMIAVLVLSLMTVTVLDIFPSSRRSLAQDLCRSGAAGVGRDLLEQARAADFATLTDAAGTTTLSNQVNGQTVTQTICWQRHVSSVNSELKNVWVELTWKGQRLVLETQIFKE